MFPSRCLSLLWLLAFARCDVPEGLIEMSEGELVVEETTTLVEPGEHLDC
jgi:hypothetical protein